MRGLFLSILTALILAIGIMGILPVFTSVRATAFITPLLVLSVMSSPLPRVLLWTGLTGLVIDSYTFVAVPLHIVRWLILVVVAWLLFERWLTNRSLYTALVLTALITAFDMGVVWISEGLQNVSSVVWSWQEVGIIMLVNLLLSTTSFTILAAFTKRFSLSFTGIDSSARSSSWYG